MISKYSLTIGMFDGCHLGHKKVIDTLLSTGNTTALFTYKNHPKSVLQGKDYPLLQSTEGKLHRLKSWGVQKIIEQEFTHEFAQMTPEEFLEKLYQQLPYSHLILGYDTHIGRGRSADKVKIKELTKKWGVEVIIVPEEKLDGAPISSSRVRGALKIGDLAQVEKLLGRPYSLYGLPQKGAGMGKKIGFPTLNFSVSNLILPPLGVYKVQYLTDKETIQGIANLGHSPTLKSSSEPLLEVHLFSHLTTNGPAEIIFESFVRPEMKFSSSEELQAQIKKDIEFVTK